MQRPGAGSDPEFESFPLEHRPALPFYLVAAAVATVAVGYGLVTPDPVVTAALETTPTLVIGSGIAYVGHRFGRFGPRHGTVVAASWILVASGFFGLSVAAFLTWFSPVRPDRWVDAVHPLLVATAACSLMGAWISYYRADLEDRYERSERLRKQMSVLDRVLRHNVRNELTVLYDFATRIDGGTDEETREGLLEHLERLQELSETARRMRQVWDTDERQELDLAAVVDGQVGLAREWAPQVDFRLDVPDQATVFAHPHAEEAVAEALENAVEHNDPSDLTIEVSVSRRDEGPVTLTIRDTGTGIPEAEASVLNQPEETSLLHGDGLGLWMMYWVVDASGGKMSFERNDTGGTTVRMSLPTPGARPSVSSPNTWSVQPTDAAPSD